MRHLATWTLTAVSAFVICALANPTGMRPPASDTPESRIPYPPPPPAPPAPASSSKDTGGEQLGPLSGFNLFFAPYRLLNIDETFFEKPTPSHYDPKVHWIAKELERLNRLKELEELNRIDHIVRYNTELKRSQLPDYNAHYSPTKASYDYDSPNDYVETDKDIDSDLNLKITKTETKVSSKEDIEKEEFKKTFALTPGNKEFYEPQPTFVSAVVEKGGTHRTMRRRGGSILGETEPSFQDIRQQRQNPNKVKTLVEENDVVNHARARAWNEASLAAAAAGRASSGADVRRVHVGRHQEEDTESLEGILVYTVMGCGLSVLILGIAFGWYTLSRKAKAAADVDYPAYGVTGPSGDNSGDRRLAHSAHMYHYQHQKQQIIAMERSGTDDKNGSISDPESEEENEEGDYTVYECPGFATTGDMEVKNPLFSDEPTPATPAAPISAPAAITADRATPSPAIVVIDDHSTE